LLEKKIKHKISLKKTGHLNPLRTAYYCTTGIYQEKDRTRIEKLTKE
jgi:hypothetical protein